MILKLIQIHRNSITNNFQLFFFALTKCAYLEPEDNAMSKKYHRKTLNKINRYLHNETY